MQAFMSLAALHTPLPTVVVVVFGVFVLLFKESSCWV